MVVMEYNYLGHYQRGDGEKVMTQEEQQTHQLQMVILLVDPKVQQDNYLGDLDGSVVVEEVEKVEIVVPTEELLKQVEVEDLVPPLHLMKDLLLVDQMD